MSAGTPTPALEGAFNFRDLGGLPTEDGRRTRHGRLYRSDSLQELTDADVRTLADELGVAFLLDLRLAEEAVQQGRGPLSTRPVCYLNVPLVDVDAPVGRPGERTVNQYLEHLESDPNLVVAVELLATLARRPTVLYCAAGKDRTGVVTALLLRSIGVTEEAVVADYMATAPNMGRIVERFGRWPRYRDNMTRLPAEIYVASEHTIRTFLRELESRYGGARGWARQKGIGATLLDDAGRGADRGAVMSLLPQDDYPLHQAPLPFDRVATSDVHFNDGYWFATYTDGVYVNAGLRVHPNMNVIDGFASIATDGEQRPARFSRPLRPHRETVVGPLHLEFVEPLRALRLVLDDSPTVLRFDLRFDAVAPPFAEAPSRHVKYGHLINDVQRYIQICRTSGVIELDDRRLDVDGWHAMRDHSWGIRSSMGPRTRHGGVGAPTRRARTPAASGSGSRSRSTGHAGFFHTHEGQRGETLDVEGRLDFTDGSSVGIVGVEHALEYHPGTTNVRGGGFALLDEAGARREYTIEPSGTPADVQGLGYYRGWHDAKSAGMYRGDELVAEGDRYAVDPTRAPLGPEHVPERRRVGPTEFPCHLEGPDGQQGMAHFEHYVLGTYEPYGFA